MGIASVIVRGEAAYLIATQATELAKDSKFSLYRVNSPECRIALWDNEERSLVVFDAPALFALAKAEAIERRQHSEGRCHEPA